jgi:hypothetical protein
LLGVIAQAAGAQDKPDFSGTWKLDPAQSQMGGGMGGGRGAGGAGGAGGGGARPGGMGGGGAQEVTVTQTGNTLQIVMTVMGEARTMTYTIGGAASKNPMAMGRMQAEMTSTSVWEGATLVTSGTASMTTPQGDRQITSREVRSLSADGKTMTVETTTTTAMGENTRKMVYVKS